jgi:hypothetical protein
MNTIFTRDNTTVELLCQTGLGLIRLIIPCSPAASDKAAKTIMSMLPAWLNRCVATSACISNFVRFFQWMAGKMVGLSRVYHEQFSMF